MQGFLYRQHTTDSSRGNLVDGMAQYNRRSISPSFPLCRVQKVDDCRDQWGYSGGVIAQSYVVNSILSVGTLVDLLQQDHRGWKINSIIN